MLRTLSIICFIISSTLSTELWSQNNDILSKCSEHMAFREDSLLHLIEAGERQIQNDKSLFLKFERYRVVYLSKTGKNPEAVKLADELILKAKAINSEPAFIHSLQLEKCRALIRSDRQKEASLICLDLCNETLSDQDTLQCITAYTLLGWANLDLEHYKDAILYLEKGKSLGRNLNYLKQNPALFSNLASCYNNIQNPQAAFENINLALKYATESNNLTTLANAYNIRADMYTMTGDNAKAQLDMESGLAIRERIGSVFYIMSDMGQLSYFYARNGQTSKGIETAKKGIALALKYKQLSKLVYLYGALAENYKTSGNIGEYASTLAKLLDLKDTLSRYNNEEALAALKNQNAIQSRDHMIALQKIELEQHKNYINGIILFFSLLIALLISLYFNYRNIQKRRLRETIEKHELAAQTAISDAEENERKRIAADLHDNIGAHAGAIKSSIKYIRDGIYNQNDILMQLEQNASEMVSHLNETIWVLKSEKLLLTNLSDRFKLWLQRLLVNFPDYQYEIKENISKDWEFSPNRMLHLFSSMKEAVTNSIKHSEGDTIHVEINGDNESWSITLSDNGTGMKEQGVAGNGIENLKNRAKTCSWDITWVSTENKGTTVKIKNA